MPGTAIAVQTDVPQGWDDLKRMAEALAHSKLVKSPLRGNPADVMVILLAARAMNLPVFWGLQSIDVVEGKPSIAAELMRARVRANGHSIRVEADDTKATVKIKLEGDDDWQEASFTFDEAKAADLAGKTNWKRYRQDMLIARATSRAVRRICPEVLFGTVYTPEELGAVVDSEGQAVYNDRGVVLEGEVVEEGTEAPKEAPASAQPSPEQISEYVENIWAGGEFDGLIDTAKLFWDYRSRGWVNLPSGSDPTETMEEVWLERLGSLIFGNAEFNPTVADLTTIWKAANGTGMLHADWRGTSISKRIAEAKNLIEKWDTAAPDRDVSQAREVLEKAGLTTETIAEAEVAEEF